MQAISQLSDDQLARHPPIGALQSWDFDGVPVTMMITPEASRIDVNAASDDLLLAFFKTSGVRSDLGLVLLNELRNAQKPDGIGQGHGPQIGDYRQGGLTSFLRNGPLESVEQLRQIPSWRAQDLNCWMSSLTVYTGQAGVDATNASQPVFAALKELSKPAPAASATPSSGSGPDPNQLVSGAVFRIEATAQVSDVTSTSLWVGRFTGDSQRPALTMRWDHGTEVHPACSQQAQ